MTGSWLAGDGPGRADVQLFCFAPAGGGPAFYRPWTAPLAQAGIAVRPVVLPGRERRLGEAPYRSVATLTGPLCAALEPSLDRPYAFFGHSMGAVVAYEAARALTAAGRGPACLMVSGHRAPSVPRRQAPVSGLPDDQFTEVLRHMGGTPPEVLSRPELMDLLLPALRADFELVETYRPLPGARLACPVAAYTGADDPYVTPEQVAAWGEVTSGEFSCQVFGGGHFYLAGGPAGVLAAVRADLGRACLASRAPAGSP